MKKRLFSIVFAVCAMMMLSTAFVSCSHDSDSDSSSGSSTYAFQGKTYSGTTVMEGVTVTIQAIFSTSGNTGTLVESAEGESYPQSFTYTVSGNTVTLTAEDADEPITATYNSSSDSFTVMGTITLTRS